MECCIGDPFDLGEPNFCKAPEVFDSIDMDSAFWELILRMINSEVPKSKIDKPVIASPTVRIDKTQYIVSTSNYAQVYRWSRILSTRYKNNLTSGIWPKFHGRFPK